MLYQDAIAMCLRFPELRLRESCEGERCDRVECSSVM